MASHTKTSNQIYFYDSLGSKAPSSARKVHIRRLVDILQLSIHRRDWTRARRAWCILARCPEFEWKKMWQTGLLLVDSAGDAADPSRSDQKRLDYLHVMMLRSPENRVSILQEIILRLIKGNRHQNALEELELYLPSFPYLDSPVLHIYAGLLCLFLAHPSMLPLNQALVREAKTHLRRAADLDPGHPVPSEFLARVCWIPFSPPTRIRR
ncbi:hypothetical protein K439DRAFT_1356594 [Ramaria rubella]|nr:hypothetical protein K439DRAFT_1356594 [Ramaria rubella]